MCARVSELLDASDAPLGIDIFFRRMNWAGGTESQLDVLTQQTQTHLQRYCDGVNAVLRRTCPWELKLLGYRPEPWRPEDVILITRMIGYLTHSWTPRILGSRGASRGNTSESLIGGYDFVSGRKSSNGRKRNL